LDLRKLFQKKEELVVGYRLAVLDIITRTEKHKAIVGVELRKLLVAVFHFNKDNLSANLLLGNQQFVFGEIKQGDARNQIAVLRKIVLAYLGNQKSRHRVTTGILIQLGKSFYPFALLTAQLVGLENDRLMRKRKVANAESHSITKHKMRNCHALASKINGTIAQIVVDLGIVSARELTYGFPNGFLTARKQTFHADDLESVHVAAAMRTPRLVAKNSRISSGDER
jgi:hypothetical protein